MNTMEHKKAISIQKGPRHKIYLVGDQERREFSSILPSLVLPSFVLPSLQQEFQVEVSCFLTLKELFVSLQSLNRSSDTLPEMIFLLADHPGQYLSDALMSIRKISPFIRLILISGPLCEGTERTEAPLPVHFRCYWHQWKRIGLSELNKYIQSYQGCFTLPEPITIEDYYLDDKAHFGISLSQLFQDKKNILIWGMEDPGLAVLLSDFAKNEGASVLCGDWDEPLPNRSEQIDTIFLDTQEPRAIEFLQHVHCLSQQWPSADIKIFVFAPQVDEVELFAQIPHCEIISKPFYF